MGGCERDGGRGVGGEGGGVKKGREKLAFPRPDSQELGY